MWVECDPRPAYCSACHNSTAEKYFAPETGAMFDAGSFHDKDMVFAAGSDILSLCDICVRGAAEAAEFKPDLHARQYNAIQRLELNVEYWRSATRRITEEYAEAMVGRPDDAPPVRRKPGRPRKVPA